MSASDKSARLPSLPSVKTADASMRSWMQAVTERLEVREGARGDKGERSVTQRDLDKAKEDIKASIPAATPAPDPIDVQLGGSTKFVDLENRVEALEIDVEKLNLAVESGTTGGSDGGSGTASGVKVYISATDPGAVGAGSFWVIP